MNKFARKQVILIEVILFISLVIHLIFDSNIESYFSKNFLMVSVFGLALVILSFVFSGIKFIMNLIDLVKIAYISLALLNIVQTFLVLPVITDGNSMDSTIKDGDFLISYVTKDVTTNDIVIVEYNDKLIVKRLIGVPGDNIYVENRKVYKNGKILEEDYLNEPHSMPDFSLNELCFNEKEYLDCSNGIPEGYYFVLGDNREVSLDSRNFGLVKEEDIFSKVLYNISKRESLNG